MNAQQSTTTSVAKRPMSEEDLEALYLSQCELAGIEEAVVLQWEDEDEMELNELREDDERVPLLREIRAYVV